MLGKHTAKEIIAEVEKLDSPVEKLFLLRQWALDNERRPDACNVIDFALQLAIKTTKHAFNARDYREIASPLPFVSEISRAQKLVQILDSQKSTIEHIGPTEDYIGLQLLLVQTEKNYDIEAARDRITDIYLYISYLKDLTTKTNCLARLVGILLDIDPQDGPNRKDSIHADVYKDLETDTQYILDTTGDHYESLHDVLQSLAKIKPEMALDFSLKMNTADRRDNSLLDIIISLLEVPIQSLNLNFVEHLYGLLEDQEFKDKVTIKVIDRFFQEKDNISNLMSQLLQFITRIRDIQDAIERCRAYCLAYSLLMRYDHKKYATLMSQLLGHLDNAWQAIDEGWKKVNNGFKIAEALAKDANDIAQIYIEKTERARNEFKISALDTAQTYLGCLLLAIRAYGGLIPKGIVTKLDLNRLTRLIDRLPSHGDKAILWADLALRYSLNKRPEDCERLVVEHVIPLIESISPNNPIRRAHIIAITASALYCAHPKTALELISSLPRKIKNAAYSQIISFLFQKVPLSDPYDTLQKHGYNISYENILEIFDLMELIDADSLVYGFTRSIVESATIGKYNPGGKFSRQQQRNIAYRLQQIIDRKLPSPRYIKHEGYKIIARAQILRLQSKDAQTVQHWSNLVNEAHSISNLHDRSYVLTTIATIMPPENFDRTKILQDAKKLADSIPVLLERIKLYQTIAVIVENVDVSLFKEYLKIAMQSTIDQEKSSKLYETQRDIVDLACQRDSAFAASLASSIDDDPIRNRLNQRIQIAKTKERMINQKSSYEDTDIDGEIYHQAAYSALTALNSGRADTVHIEHTREFLRIASRLPLQQSYPILIWVIENAAKRFANTDSAREYLRPVYEATLLGAELTGRITAAYSIPPVQQHDTSSIESSSTGLVLQPGDREKAVQYLKDWFEHEVHEYLKIQDPYFELDDLKFLRLLASVNPNCEVYVLTSLKNQKQTTQPFKDAYRDFYTSISDQHPPDTEIVIVGNQQGIAPFHDRWLITKSGGLRLGTSLSSLGQKVSEISCMSQEEAMERESILDQYLIYHKKDSEEGKLQYETFSL